ncbi:MULTISPECIES: outer membrane protein [unclassified Vibrio]|uniref:outer membrane protein n=1 Tax=unclassified Vibrio TaxID=2614977 RepID=UPI0009EF359D|nr:MULTISPECIES: outer membrane beta-barrel protein [unclassified Vibrio]
MNKKTLSLLLLACSYPAVTQAEVYITPMVGYGMGGSFDTEDGNEYDIDRNVNYNLAIETNVDAGRLGLFYSQQNSSIESIDRDTSLRYIHFQSAVYYPSPDNWSPYLGLSLGGTQIDIQGADSDYKFSLGVYGGLEYKITDNFAFQGQLRYLGTLVDSDSITLCQSSSTSNTCKIAFSGNWMNQLQANAGFTFSF